MPLDKLLLSGDFFWSFIPSTFTGLRNPILQDTSSLQVLILGRLVICLLGMIDIWKMNLSFSLRIVLYVCCDIGYVMQLAVPSVPLILIALLILEEAPVAEAFICSLVG